MILIIISYYIAYTDYTGYKCSNLFQIYIKVMLQTRQELWILSLHAYHQKLKIVTVNLLSIPSHLYLKDNVSWFWSPN